ncbi:MAG: GFA family protein [Pseudomonadales bacterium]|nr:GFA family protein [Pseudomonadales bacterium]
MAIANYNGSCQCGAVTYTVDVDLDKTITCNCSRCQRMGFVLAFAPQENFNLISGKGSLTEYLFNKGTIHHQFCKVCGVESFAYGAMPDGTPTIAVNVNCLEGVNPRELKSHHVDGRSF